MNPILPTAVTERIAAIAGERRAGAHLGIVAPGGYGKTTLLRYVGEAVRDTTGIEPVTGLPPFGQVGGGVLLVDDAHQLDDTDLRELRRLATAAPVRLVVAARPWPRPAALTELLDLAQDHLLPTTLDPAQIRDLLPRPLRTDRHVDFVHAQTGGVPAFVTRLARALDTELDVPAAALAEFRHELSRLDERVLRFLLAADAGVGLNLDLLADLLETEPGTVSAVVEAARATGFVGTAGSLVPIAQRAIRAQVPVERRVWIRQRLAESRLARGGQVLPLMRPLVNTGIGGDGAAAAFEAAAAEALPTDPALAAKLYAAAVTAGRAPATVGARRAHALALSGDLDGALRLADQVLTTEKAPDRTTAATVAAAALAHRGQLGRSAELYRWAGAGQFAALGSTGVGELVDAAGEDGPPTSLSSAISLMAQGLHESVTGQPTAALSTVVRSATTLEPVGRAVLLPDSPAALGALLALHYAELETAKSLLERAIAAGTGGAPFTARHRLLLAWTAMTAGELPTAAEGLAAVCRARGGLEPRDRLFAVAIETGLARRAGDAAALGRAWSQAGDAILRHPVDLFTFLPLGELTMAAARLRDESRLAAHLTEARTLLKSLGDPPLWSMPLWWSGLHAALIAGRTDDAAEHADAMATAAAGDEQFGVLARAARCWLDTTTGTVEPDAVEAAARALHGIGLTWDAARLAGNAATRTADRAAMVRLLDCARMIQGKPVSARRSSTAERQGDQQLAVNLSNRELQVAELVVSGLTYKDVGDRLFISAKTVEHHVARMRQRLGASSRSELLSQLRSLVGSAGVRK